MPVGRGNVVVGRPQVGRRHYEVHVEVAVVVLLKLERSQRQAGQGGRAQKLLLQDAQPVHVRRASVRLRLRVRHCDAHAGPRNKLRHPDLRQQLGNLVPVPGARQAEHGCPQVGRSHYVVHVQRLHPNGLVERGYLGSTQGLTAHRDI